MAKVRMVLMLVVSRAALSATVVLPEKSESSCQSILPKGEQRPAIVTGQFEKNNGSEIGEMRGAAGVEFTAMTESLREAR